MKKVFLIFAICLELVASGPYWGRQAFASSGNQPQNVVRRQQEYQYPVPNYSTYGVPDVENTFAGHWPVDHIAQPSVYYPHYDNIEAVPQSHETANPYLPHQLIPSVQPIVPVHYNNPANVQVLHENLNWLGQHYPSLQKTLAKAQSGPNSFAKPSSEVASGPPVPKTSPPATKQPAPAPASSNSNETIPQNPVANATAEGTPKSDTPVATATEAKPQTISPELTKAVNDANEAVTNGHNISDRVINTLKTLVGAAEKAATAKADPEKPFDVNSTSTVSSNPDLNNLSKLYKDSQDQIKTAYAAFATLQDKVNDLVKKVEDNANSALDSKPPSSSPPVDSSNTEEPNSEPVPDSQEQPALSTEEDEEPPVSDVSDDENEEVEPSS